MMEESKNQNIVFQWLTWHFFDIPKEIFKTWKNFLLFVFNYFSVFLLLKTLFSPWRKYEWSYGKGFDVKIYLEVLFSNIISRILGAFVRSFLILLGLIAGAFVFLIGLIVFLGWLLMPAILIFGLFFAIRVIF